jgi:hypothetical protein
VRQQQGDYLLATKGRKGDNGAGAFWESEKLAIWAPVAIGYGCLAGDDASSPPPRLPMAHKLAPLPRRTEL